MSNLTKISSNLFAKKRTSYDWSNGPIVRSAFSCKTVLRYFGKVRHKSNVRVIQYDWLIVLYNFIPLVRIASFLIVKNSCVREELTDVNSTLDRAPPQLTLFTSPTTPSTLGRMCDRQFPTL